MAKRADRLTLGEAQTLIGILLHNERETITEWAVMGRVSKCEASNKAHTHVVYFPYSMRRALCLITDAAETIVECGDEIPPEMHYGEGVYDGTEDPEEYK